MELKELQKASKRFRTEIIFNEDYDDLDITSVFLNKKDGVPRAIVIIEEHEDVRAAEKQCAKYFGKKFKVISLKGKPSETATLSTGHGISHHQTSGWGTLGGFFRRDKDKKNWYGLSNNHVLADLNRASVGDKIFYKPNVNAGTLFSWIELNDPPKTNKIDAALFKLNSAHDRKWVPNRPNKSTGAVFNMKVYKQGNASGYTKGVITSKDGSSIVELNKKTFHFVDIITIKGIGEDFNAPGDSGSIVFSMNHKMVGIVFAKMGNYCYALPIKHIAPLLKK